MGFRVAVRVTAFGASCPSRRVPAIVSFLNPEPTLSLGGGNWSSCPTPAVRNPCRDRLNRAQSGHSSVVHISAHGYKMAYDEDKERFEEKLKRIARAKPKTAKKD